MTPGDGVPERFPGFHVLDQAPKWDERTRAVVLSRVGRPPDDSASVTSGPLP